MELLEAFLVNTEGLNHVSAFAALLVLLIDFPGDPMVGWHIIFDAVYHVGQFGEAKLVILVARDHISVVFLEQIEMGLGERGQRSA